MSPKDESPSPHRQNQLLKSGVSPNSPNNPNNPNNETDYENGYTSSDDDLSQKKNIEDWRRKFLQRILEWWKDEEYFSLKTKTWTAVTAILVLAAATAARRQQARHKPNDTMPSSSSLSRTATTMQPRRSSVSLLWLLGKALLRSNDNDFFAASGRRNLVDVSLSMLQRAARQGLVKKALVGSGEILYQDRESSFGTNGSHSSWKRTLLPPHSPGVQADLLELLSKHGCDDVAALPESLSSRLAAPLLAALPFVYLALMYKIFKNIHDKGNDLKLITLEEGRTTATRFSDVAGLEPIMPEVQEIVHYLKHSQNYRALGAQPPRGILLYGPPGAGKTLLARALAGEANAAFLACSGSDFCEMYVGRGAARVRSLFERARSQALQRSKQHYRLSWWKRMVSSSWTTTMTTTAATTTIGPPPEFPVSPPPTAIIFIDEFDALAKSRAYGGSASNGNDERESTLNQLLTEMDGFASASSTTSDNDVTIIVVAATNRPDVLDPAILRRFDRQIHVSYPNADGRRDILQVHARSSHCVMEEIDWSLLASDEWTGDFSGSDLRNVVNDAALLAVRERCPRVQQSHMERAIQRARQIKYRTDLAGNMRSTQPQRQHFLYIPPPNNP